MKKRLAILLFSVLVLTCAIPALAASAATFTDVVNLLPESTDGIEQNDPNGTATFALTDDGLVLTRAAESQIYWPSIKYEVLEEVDLSKTPYLHLQFTCSSEGENEGRGVNGHVMYTVDGGEEQDGWFSEIGGRDVNDYRGSTDAYFDFTKVANTTGKITVTRIILSIYGEAGETVVWNALAFASASDGNDEPEESSEEPSEEPSEAESTPEESSAAEPSSEASSEEPAESTPSVSSQAPETTLSSEATSDAPSEAEGLGTLAIVLIVVGCVAVAAAVVVIVIKRKKK